jgi:hypothetical protein
MITLMLANLVVFVLGAVVGWALYAFVRRMRIMGRVCRFCNGHGYFASARDEGAVMAQVHEESSRFRP